MPILHTKRITALIAYLDATYSHLARRAVIYLWLLVGVVVFGHYFYLSVNLTHSLPGTVFLIEKGVHPKKGELAAFVYGGGGPYPRGSFFLKIVTGTPGDIVSIKNEGYGYHDFFVNSKFVGRAKPVSLSGKPLTKGPAGVLPPGSYYMAAPNPDSLDSRYNWVGWVRDSQIIGRGIRIF